MDCEVSATDFKVFEADGVVFEAVALEMGRDGNFGVGFDFFEVEGGEPFLRVCLRRFRISFGKLNSSKTLRNFRTKLLCSPNRIGRAGGEDVNSRGAKEERKLQEKQKD